MLRSRIKLSFLVLVLLVFLMGCQTTTDTDGEPTQQLNPVETAKPTESEATYPGPAENTSPSISLPLVVYNPYPGPSEGVNNYVDWPEVEQAILNGEITEAYQSTTLHVTLVKENGDVILSIEPEIDEVFRVLDRCGDACKDVIRGTE